MSCCCTGADEDGEVGMDAAAVGEAADVGDAAGDWPSSANGCSAIGWSCCPAMIGGGRISGSPGSGRGGMAATAAYVSVGVTAAVCACEAG